MSSVPQPIMPDGLPVDRSEWRTHTSICRYTGASWEWVDARLRKRHYAVHYAIDPRNPLKGKVKFYEPAASAEIGREWQQVQALPPQGSHLSITEVATRLDSDNSTILRILEDEGIGTPIRSRSPSNHVITTVPTGWLPRIKKGLGEPPPGGWITVVDLSKATGIGVDTIKRRLAAAGISGRMYIQPSTHRPALFYPPKARGRLKPPPACPPAGDYYSATDIMRALGRSVRWLEVRLARPHIAAAAEKRLNANREPSLHYPPWVFEELALESEVTRYTRADDKWYTASRISELIGRQKTWVDGQLARPEHDCRKRMMISASGNRAHLHYPRAVYLALKREAEGKKEDA